MTVTLRMRPKILKNHWYKLLLGFQCPELDPLVWIIWLQCKIDPMEELDVKLFMCRTKVNLYLIRCIENLTSETGQRESFFIYNCVYYNRDISQYSNNHRNKFVSNKKDENTAGNWNVNCAIINFFINAVTYQWMTSYTTCSWRMLRLWIYSCAMNDKWKQKGEALNFWRNMKLNMNNSHKYLRGFY